MRRTNCFQGMLVTWCAVSVMGVSASDTSRTASASYCPIGLNSTGALPGAYTHQPTIKLTHCNSQSDSRSKPTLTNSSGPLPRRAEQDFVFLMALSEQPEVVHERYEGQRVFACGCTWDSSAALPSFWGAGCGAAASWSASELSSTCCRVFSSNCFSIWTVHHSMLEVASDMPRVA